MYKRQGCVWRCQSFTLQFSGIGGTATNPSASVGMNISVTLDGVPYAGAGLFTGADVDSGGEAALAAFTVLTTSSDFARLRSEARIARSGTAITITSRRSVAGSPTGSVALRAGDAGGVGITGYPIAQTSVTTGLGTEVDDIVRVQIRNAANEVLATFVPTPIRQLLKVRGGAPMGGAMGGKMAMPGKQPAGHLSVMTRTPGSRGTKSRR